MRQFIEFIPIALFAGVFFYTRDIYLATGVLMAAVLVQVGVEFGLDRTISKRTQFLVVVVLIAGGATLVLQDELFIKWKPTVLNWMFSIAMLASQLFTKENYLKKMMGDQMELPDHVWKNLSYGWALGFFIAGALNLIVAYGFSTEFWVAYKLVGGFGLTLLYVIIMIVYLVKGGYIQEPEDESSSTETSMD